jgi:lysosomal Pro-X carboxypeptidase
LIDILSEAIGTISVVNYPYETNFLGPLPAWPVKALCEAAINVNETSTSNYDANDVSVFNWTNILSLKAAAELYYNPYGNLTCLNISTSPITLGSPAHCD